MLVRKIVKLAAKALGVELRHYPLFRRAIDLLARTGPKPFFVQIGANNGIDFDDFYSIVCGYDLPGLVVEPLPFYFETLEQLYKRHRKVSPVRLALHPEDKQAVIYRPDPDKIMAGWQHGLGSFSREHLLRFGVPDEAIIAEPVECVTLAKLVERYVPSGQSVDILVSDTEGFDDEIIKMVDFRRVRPKVLKFEAKHLSRPTLKEIEIRLLDEGYVIHKALEDWVAVDAPLASRFSYFASGFRRRPRPAP